MQIYLLPSHNFIETARSLTDITLLAQRRDAYLACRCIFPAFKTFECTTCWDAGVPGGCCRCGKMYRASVCKTCKDKGMLPQCPACRRKPGPKTEISDYANHPVILYWKRYRYALLCYTFVMCEECDRRGINTPGDGCICDVLGRFGKRCGQHSLSKVYFPKDLVD
jgi:hypothetical protein